MEKNEENKETNLIDKNLILSSFINEGYLEQKFNELKNHKQEEIEINDNMLSNKIIIEDKKLTIFNVDKVKNIEHKIYESDDFCQVIKKFTKIEIEKDNFDFKLVKIMKNGIFIIESKDIVTYGAFFFIKFNDSKKEIEIISEEKERQIQFITEYSDGNFAYNCYIHRPVYHLDIFFIFDVKKNIKHLLHEYSEYDGIFDSKFVTFENGFAFNNFFIFDEKNNHSYLNIVEGFDLKSYTIDFIGDIEQLIYDDKFIYLLKKDNNKDDNIVYIFNIKSKKFYPNFFKIFNDKKETEEIKSNENDLRENKNSNKKNKSKKKKKKCIII